MVGFQFIKTVVVVLYLNMYNMVNFRNLTTHAFYKELLLFGKVESSQNITFTESYTCKPNIFHNIMLK